MEKKMVKVEEYECYLSEEGKVYNKSGRKIKPFINKKGNLCVNIGGNVRSVMWLMSQAFKEEGREILSVKLKDGDKTNCRLDNLLIKYKEELPDDTVQIEYLPPFIWTANMNFDEGTFNSSVYYFRRNS